MFDRQIDLDKGLTMPYAFSILLLLLLVFNDEDKSTFQKDDLSSQCSFLGISFQDFHLDNLSKQKQFNDLSDDPFSTRVDSLAK